MGIRMQLRQLDFASPSAHVTQSMEWCVCVLFAHSTPLVPWVPEHIINTPTCLDADAADKKGARFAIEATLCGSGGSRRLIDGIDGNDSYAKCRTRGWHLTFESTRACTHLIYGVCVSVCVFYVYEATSLEYARIVCALRARGHRSDQLCDEFRVPPLAAPGTFERTAPRW